MAGKVDVWNVPGHSANDYIKRQGPGFSPSWWRNDGGLVAVANTRRTPIDDPRVPRALRLLFDYQELRRHGLTSGTGSDRTDEFFPLPCIPGSDRMEYSNLLDWKQPEG